MSVNSYQLPKRRVLLFPDSGARDSSRQITAGDILKYRIGFNFVPKTSYLEFTFAIGKGGDPEGTTRDLNARPFLDYLDVTNYRIKDLLNALPEKYITTGGISLEDPEKIVTRDMWKQILTANGKSRAYGGFFYKYATSLFSKVELYAPKLGSVLERDENTEFSGMFRAERTYANKLRNMTTFFNSRRTRDRIMNYAEIGPDEPYLGYNMEVRIPLSMILDSFNIGPNRTQYLIRKGDVPFDSLDFFPGPAFGGDLQLALNVKTPTKIMNAHVYNDLGMQFYLNDFIDHNKLPMFYLEENTVELDTITADSQPYFDLMTNIRDGDNMFVQVPKWLFGDSGDAEATRYISSRFHYQPLNLEEQVRTIGMMLVPYNSYELFTNPSILTAQIQFGSEEVLRVPEKDPMNSLPEFWDNYIQNFYRPWEDPTVFVSDEQFDSFFSILAPRDIELPDGNGETITVYPSCESFPVMLPLANGYFAGQEIHRGSVTFFMSFNDINEYRKRLLPGVKGKLRKVVCIERMSSSMFTYAVTDGGFFVTSVKL